MFLVLLLTESCNKTSTGINKPLKEGWIEIPAGFPETVYKPYGNLYSEEGYELGKKLFFDKRLSATGEISCASCHLQEFAFSDAGNKYSKGINSKTGKRNAPALFNLAWHKAFMADGGITHIEFMPLAPLIDTNEMGMAISDLLNKLQQLPEYPPLFFKAFGKSEVTDQHLYYALVQYLTSLISANSKYDQVMAGKAIFTAAEDSGNRIFDTKCSGCHKPPLFSDFSYRNNGLPQYGDDFGRYRITQETTDKNLFKVPSLRNIEKSYPYMHNGSLASLEAVLDHYATGIKPNPNLDVSLQNFNLSPQEKQSLLAFLKTLTDPSFLNNPKFRP